MGNKNVGNVIYITLHESFVWYKLHALFKDGHVKSL